MQPIVPVHQQVIKARVATEGYLAAAKDVVS